MAVIVWISVALIRVLMGLSALSVPGALAAHRRESSAPVRVRVAPEALHHPE